MSDPYKILGISRDATDEEVKKAYRQLSRKYHPDANVNNPNKDKAEEMFKLVQQAYQQVMYERQHPYSSSGYGTSGYGRPQGSPRPGGSPYSSQQSSGQTWQDEDGTTYTHILSPTTGEPAVTNLKEVCVISDDALLADCLATGLYAMGRNSAVRCWRANRNFEMILVTADNEILCTSGLTEQFSLSASGYKLSYIE